MKLFLKLLSRKSGFAALELVFIVTLLAGIAASTKLVRQIQNPQKQAATGACVSNGCKPIDQSCCQGSNLTYKADCASSLNSYYECIPIGGKWIDPETGKNCIGSTSYGTYFSLPNCEADKNNPDWKTAYYAAGQPCSDGNGNCYNLSEIVVFTYKSNRVQYGSCNNQSQTVSAFNKKINCVYITNTVTPKPTIPIPTSPFCQGYCSPNGEICQSPNQNTGQKDCPQYKYCCEIPASPSPGGGGSGNTPTPGGGGGGGGPGGGGNVCSIDTTSNACKGKSIGDICDAGSGTKCTYSPNMGSDGYYRCKCDLGGGGGGPPPPADTPPPQPTVPPGSGGTCTIDKYFVKKDEAVTFTAQSATEFENLYFEVRNRENPDGAGSFKPVCVTSGGDINTPSAACPAGTYPLIFKDPDTSLRTSGSLTVNTADVFLFDNNIWQPYGGFVNAAQVTVLISTGSNPLTPLGGCAVNYEYYRPAVCSGSTISGNILSPSTPIELSLQGNPPVGTSISKFELAFYNNDNLFGPGNPKPICVEYGIGDATWSSQQCPEGTTHYVKILDNPDLSNSATFNLIIDDFQFPDLHPDFSSPDKLPVNIQTNGYFLLSDTGFSRPEAACVKGFRINSTPLTSPTEIPTSTPIPSPTPTPLENWYGPDGNLCISQIYRRAFSDTQCISKIGYETDTINIDPGQFHCITYGELINRDGWISLGEIPDGLKVMLSFEDTLPDEYRAEEQGGNNKIIELDHTDRTMNPGVWNVYRLCQDDQPIVPVACTEDGSGECFKAGGLTVETQANSFNMSDDDTCTIIGPDNPVSGDLYGSLYKCAYTWPPVGSITGTLKVDYFNADQMNKVVVYLRLPSPDENDDTADTYIDSKIFNMENGEIPDNTPIDFTFENLYVNRTFELYVKAFDENDVYLNYQGIVYESSCSALACQLTPGNTVDFKITFPQDLPEELTRQGLNEAYSNMIKQWVDGNINALKMSEFLKKVKDAPGLKTATFDPNIPGGN